MPTYGIVVEGTYDTFAYRSLIQRLVPDVRVVSRETGGISHLKKMAPVLVHDLEHAVDGGPVERAFIIADADGKDSAQIDAAIRGRLQGEAFPFPVMTHVTVQTVETWLLCDVDAIMQIAGDAALEPVAEAPEMGPNLELLPKPKQILGRLLVHAGVPQTPKAYGLLAETLRFERLRARCPGFASFEAKVIPQP